MKKLFALALLLGAFAFPFGARAQSLSASPSSLFAGQSSTAAWSGIAAPGATDWIGLYLPGAADTAFISWRYTDGNAAGSVPFLIPVGTAAGTYELRLFSNNGFTLLATSSSFTVNTPPPATLAASPSSLLAGQSTTASWTNIVAPSATDWIGLFTPASDNTAAISWHYTDGTAAGSAPFQIPYGTAAGTYELRLFSNNTFTLLATSSSVTVTSGPAMTLSASPTSLLAGQSTTATWTNISAPSTKDWIGLYTTGSADTAPISWRYTDGSASGNVTYQIPFGTAAGTYELRLFSDDTFTLLATSSSITVTAGPAITLSASPSTVLQGQQSTATWANISAPTVKDWIGLYLPGASDTAPVSWQYTDGSAAGSAQFTIPATAANGTYQLRLFSNDGFTRLATSNNFSVGVLTMHYIQVDHLNTPRAIFDANQQLKWKWDQQEPFGVNAPDENPSALGSFEFPLRLPGQYSDKETSLNYNYFRDYDPSLGRYAQSDPIGLRAGLNTFAYVYGQPLKLHDRRGLDAQTCMLGGPCDPGDIPPLECVENSEKCSDPQRDRGDPQFTCAVGCITLSLTIGVPVERGVDAVVEHKAAGAAKAMCKMFVKRVFFAIHGYEILECRQECYACEDCPIWNSPDNPNFPRTPPLPNAYEMRQKQSEMRRKESDARRQR